MAKRLSFQLYLNPENARDQHIITWLTAIPRYRRSPRIKDILSRAIHGEVPASGRADPAPTRPDAGQLATRLLSSLPKRRT